MPISNSMDETVRGKNTPLNALYEPMGTDTVHVTVRYRFHPNLTIENKRATYHSYWYITSDDRTLPPVSSYTLHARGNHTHHADLNAGFVQNRLLPQIHLWQSRQGKQWCRRECTN